MGKEAEITEADIVPITSDQVKVVMGSQFATLRRLERESGAKFSIKQLGVRPGGSGVLGHPLPTSTPFKTQPPRVCPPPGRPADCAALP